MLDDDPCAKLQTLYSKSDFENCIHYAQEISSRKDLSDDQIKFILQTKGLAEYMSNRILDAKITFAELVIRDEKYILENQDFPHEILSFYNGIRAELIAKKDNKALIIENRN